jgi:single-strand DNA-binding protein
MNLLTIGGYMGGDPETRFTQSGTAVTTFSLPVESGFGENKKTTWVECALFGKAGANKEHGLVQHLHKGKFVVVAGELQVNVWQGREKEMFTVKCIVREITPGPKVGGRSEQAPPAPAGEHHENSDPIDDDSIPF